MEAADNTEGDKAGMKNLLKYAWYRISVPNLFGRSFQSRKDSSLEGSHLCRASAAGEVGLVKALVEVLGVEVKARGRYGLTALHCAALHGHTELVRYLMGRGADPEAKEDVDGLTPLHIAAFCNALDVAGGLVEHGANVNARTNLGFNGKGLRTPLVMASEQGHVDMCRYLVSQGAQVDARVGEGLTPLHFACTKGRPAVVAFLLSHGADPNAATDTGATPLLMATNVNGDLTCVQLLVTHGARVDEACNGFTPLTKACLLHHIDIVRYLATRGADVNHALNGCPELVMACFQGHADVARVLIEHGADVNKPNLRDGQTPLLSAAEQGHADLVKYLLQKGADAMAVTYDMRNAASLAASRGQRSIASFLSQETVPRCTGRPK